MGPFSPLAREYSKELKLRTPTGLVTINRRIFIEIYDRIRPLAMSNRAIRAGWKRTGLYPLNKQRILDDEDIKNFSRTTPEYQPEPIPEGLNGLFSTLKKFEDIRELISTVQAVVSPSKRMAVEKLGNAAIQEYTGSQLLSKEVQQLRQFSITNERNARSKRLAKEANQRSFNVEQIRKAREGKTKQKVPYIVQKTKKKLVIALPSKTLD